MLPVRVYFEDTDFSGLVYHASYVRWCERGRSDFLRLLGGDHRRLIDGTGGAEPAAFVVRRMTFDFLKPARIDELLEVDDAREEHRRREPHACCRALGVWKPRSSKPR